MLETGQSNSPNSGESHQTPPEGVKEGPGSSGIILKRQNLSIMKNVSVSSEDLLGKVDQRGKCEDRDPDQQHEQPELLVCLVEGVDEGLEPREVAHQLEDPHNAHHPHQPDDLT